MILKTFELHKINVNTIFYLLYGKNDGLKAECISEILSKNNGKQCSNCDRLLVWTGQCYRRGITD